jgi:parallel beta-helix repeat protein
MNPRLRIRIQRETFTSRSARGAAWQLVGLVLVLGAASPAAAQVACGADVGPGEEVVLTRDLVCDRVGEAITVFGPAVLDLNGFTIRCADQDGDGRIPFDGIRVEGAGAVVRNGRITGCGTGLEVVGTGRHSISLLVLQSNVDDGMLVRSDANRIVDVSAFFNGKVGYDVIGKRNLLLGNAATGNGDIGFRSGGGNTLRRNIASNHEGEGFFVGGERALLLENRAILNDTGFTILGARHRLVENEAEDNGTGFLLDGITERNRLVENVASRNDFNGVIVFGNANRLIGTIAESNGQVGILLFEAERNVVSRSEASGNGVVDLSETDPDCGTNRWRKNEFESASQVCIR